MVRFFQAVHARSCFQGNNCIDLMYSMAIFMSADIMSSLCSVGVCVRIRVNKFSSKTTRSRDMLFFLKATLSRMKNCSRHANLSVYLFARAISRGHYPDQTLQHFITIYVLGHKYMPLCEYETWICLNFSMNFLNNFNALKLMKSSTKSPIT